MVAKVPGSNPGARIVASVRPAVAYNERGELFYTAIICPASP
jgi:hypothetical protein